MPTTPLFALRYPAATDSADVPRDMQNLATDVDNNINKPPAGILNGEAAVWNGSAWARSSVTKLAGYLDLNNSGTQTMTGSLIANGSIGVVKAGGTPAFTAHATGESADRFGIDTDGSHTWGGGSGVPDLNLYRGGVGYLATDYDFGARANGANRILLRDNGRAEITFGSAADANLYRLSPGNLKTDSIFTAGAGLNSIGQTTMTIPNTSSWAWLAQLSNGNLCAGLFGNVLYFGDANAGNFTDTTMYRASPGILNLNKTLLIGMWSANVASNATLTPDLANGQVLVYNVNSGGAGTLTINPPTVTGLPAGATTVFYLVIKNNSGGLLNFNFNSYYSNVITVTANNGNVMVWSFVWDGAKWRTMCGQSSNSPFPGP